MHEVMLPRPNLTTLHFDDNLSSLQYISNAFGVVANLTFASIYRFDVVNRSVSHTF